MPLYRRLPKRGFKNRNRVEMTAVNMGRLEVFEDGAEVTVEALLEKGIIKSGSVTINGHVYSLAEDGTWSST